MSSSKPLWLEWALMVLISALLFVEFFQLNGFLFDFLEHTQGVNWIFLPAGFRVLLVLVLGLPGATGIALGTLWLNLPAFDSAHQLYILSVCLASGFGPWIVKYGMQQRRHLNHELKNISSASLLQFVLLYASLNAVAHQTIFWCFDTTNTAPWIDVWPMFIGDTLGALLILYTFKLCLPWLRTLVRPKA